MHLCREQLLETPGQAGVCVRLYHLTHEQAAQRVGTASGILFQHRPPRFGFSLAEQELLWCGLYGETDEELGAQLGLALVTIKKRWLSIYERVSAIAPELLAASQSEARRGLEKRRRLLSYLRHHMEELRPVERPKASK